MENKCFNPKLFVHTTTQIFAHYYKKFVEINEKFEKMTKNEYSKMMFSKANNCKDKKERDKIANEYAENIQKYYPFRKNNDYYLFFINYFDYFLPKLDKENLDKIKLITLSPIKDIITLARK